MLLELKAVSKSFGSLVVADAIDLQVGRGDALGIIGPNGAGKTTLFNLITGGLRPDAGSVWFDGRDVTAVPAQQRCFAGMGRSFQVPLPFEGLSVFENVAVGGAFGQGKSVAQVQDECLDILALTGLLDKANLLAGQLTLLERKRLEMARALATGPELLLLDEIAGGLTEAECDQLVATIREVHARGVTIVWIEHVVHALMAVVDRIFVLNFGRKVQEGEPEAVMNSAEVQEIYLGIEA